LARNSGENARLDRLIEILLGAQRLNDQRLIINYRPVSKNQSGSFFCQVRPGFHG